MTVADLTGLLAFARGRTLELLEAVAGTGRAAEVLAWRPGPGRANLGWQFLHLAATDHRFLTLRFQGKPAADTALAEGYGFGSVPADALPATEEIRAALATHRAALLAFLATKADADLEAVPPAPPAAALGAPAPPTRTFRQWLELLAWHEAHHHGQAHLTRNLWKAATEAAAA